MGTMFEPTLGEQMLAADQETRKKRSGMEMAASQWSDALGMLGAGPGQLIQNISRANAIKGVVKPLKELGILKANLPSVKKISKDIAQTPQTELDRITTVGANQVGPNAVASTITKPSLDNPLKRTVDISFNPTRIDEAAAAGDWWHELVHGRQRAPNSGERGPAGELITMRNKMVNPADPSSSKGLDTWSNLPTERHAMAMQTLMRDPEILKQVLIGGRVSPELYNEMYSQSLQKALRTGAQKQTPRLLDAVTSLAEAR